MRSPAGPGNPAVGTPAAGRTGRRWRALSRRFAIFGALVAGGALALVRGRATLGPHPIQTLLAARLLRARPVGAQHVTYQRGRADCGVAALAMWLARQGVQDTAWHAAARARADRAGGTSLVTLAALAARHGVPAQGWRLDAFALARDGRPAIVHLGGHFVTLDSVRRDTAFVRDPAAGGLGVPLEMFGRAMTGAVLLPATRAPMARSRAPR